MNSVHMFPSNGSYFLKFQPGFCTFIAFRPCMEQGHNHLHVPTLSCNIQRRDVLATGLESTAGGPLEVGREVFLQINGINEFGKLGVRWLLYRYSCTLS